MTDNGSGLEADSLGAFILLIETLPVGQTTLNNAIAAIVGAQDVLSISLCRTRPGDPLLWEVSLNSDAAYHSLLNVARAKLNTKDLSVLQIVSDERHPSIYQISGLDPQATLGEIRQAFWQHGRLLKLDEEAYENENRKKKIGSGSKHWVLLAPHGLEKLPSSFDLMIHDDAVQVSQRLGIESVKPSIAKADTDTEDFAGSETDPDYFSADGEIFSESEFPYSESTKETSTIASKYNVNETSPEPSQAEHKDATSGSKNDEEAQQLADKMAEELIKEEWEARKKKEQKKLRKKSKKKLKEWLSGDVESLAPNSSNAVQSPALANDEKVENLLRECKDLKTQQKAFAEVTAKRELAFQAQIKDLQDRELQLEKKIALAGSRRKEAEVAFNTERKAHMSLKKEHQSIVTKLRERKHSLGRKQVRSASMCVGEKESQDSPFLNRPLQKRDIEDSLSTSTMSLSSCQSTDSVFTVASTRSQRSTRPVLLASPARWDGRGSPYLLHLLYASNVLIPYLVEGLVKKCTEASGLLLVGGSAWNAYYSVPVDTDDVDFTVENEDPQTLMQSAIEYAYKHERVRHQLAVVAAVSEATKKFPPMHSQAPGTRDLLFKAVAQAENATCDDTADCVGMLQLVPSDQGWRIKLGHRGLIDLCNRSNEPTDTKGPGPDKPLLCPISAVLPTKHLYPFEGSAQEVSVQVAPTSTLLHQLGSSLRSKCPWRIQRDLVRLHMVAYASELSNDTAVTKECVRLLEEVYPGSVR